MSDIYLDYIHLWTFFTWPIVKMWNINWLFLINLIDFNRFDANFDKVFDICPWCDLWITAVNVTHAWKGRLDHIQILIVSNKSHISLREVIFLLLTVKQRDTWDNMFGSIHLSVCLSALTEGSLWPVCTLLMHSGSFRVKWSSGRAGTVSDSAHSVTSI